MAVALTYWMEVALWVALGAMAVDFLAGLFQSLKGNTISSLNEPVLGYLKDIVYYVLPLLMLAGFSTMDETEWIVKAAYFVGAAAVVIKYLKDIRAKF
ncbi:hypothetical protein [Cohnella thailandensis]|uniref:Holin n=1 Tax=Cohnella thailandensis TaxID=557557 RepID=A0A841STU2_9BACL|nr:hypothetical protein [Cohnella thailandensis]MBB6633047.1 hypothetical protein [Cohnella thailandensis]MBP1975258.1 hypothetical protein [Cohnella thailandensis]